MQGTSGSPSPPQPQTRHCRSPPYPTAPASLLLPQQQHCRVASNGITNTGSLPTIRTPNPQNADATTSKASAPHPRSAPTAQDQAEALAPTPATYAPPMGAAPLSSTRPWHSAPEPRSEE